MQSIYYLARRFRNFYMRQSLFEAPMQKVGGPTSIRRQQLGGCIRVETVDPSGSA
jgi:hypothetical protein